MTEHSTSPAQFFAGIRRGPCRLGWRAMPWLMRTGMWVSAVFAVMLTLFVPLAALGIGVYEINERSVSGPYFLSHAYPILLPFMVLLAALAYGYWTERLWARPLPIFFWVGMDIILLWEVLTGHGTRADNLEMAVWGAFYIIVAVWYCFYKQSVARYYRALERAYGVGRA